MLITDGEAPFSLYLDLEEGKLADLEVVSRASLELIAALKDFAFFAHPNVGVRVTIQSSDQGSLWLKTIIKLVFDIDVEGDQVDVKVNTLQAILIGLGIFIGGSVASHYTEMGLQIFDRELFEIQPDGKPVEKSEDEKSEVPAEIQGKVRDIVEGAIRNGVGEAQVRKFYSEIKSDPAIKGVGISYDHETKPKIIIPREMFAALSRAPETAPDAGKKSRTDRLDVLLTQPRLTADKKAWRFQVGGIEFAAKITDQKFVSELLSGKIGIRMVEGVFLNVDMKIDEENVEGVWRITSRTVTHVHGVKEAPDQASFFRLLNAEEDGDQDE
jgi:hypothetical protein